VLHFCRETHRTVLSLAEDLDDDQLRWRPAGYSTSIGFHLWHLARESDYLIAVILQRVPQLGPDFGEAQEIWRRKGLAAQWGFPPELHETVGTGMSDEAASQLPLPGRAEVVAYLQAAYARVEQFVALLDARYPGGEDAAEELSQKIANIRLNLLVFLAHDCRHLGMMECLKGLQTGFGSATEQPRRKAEA
jgi:hypothetical protein